MAKLIELEDRPWGEYRGGKPLTCNILARLLSPFGIKPKQIRIGQNKQGYHISDFDDTFSRYVPYPPLSKPYNPTIRYWRGLEANLKPYTYNVCRVLKTAESRYR